MGFSNIAKAILLVLSFLTYIPQFQRIISRGDSQGISLRYVLLNSVVATEQLILFLFLLVESAEHGIPGTMHKTPTLGDWLNVAQIVTVWVASTGLLLLCTRYPPPSTSPIPSLLTYLLTLTFFLVPALICCIPRLRDPSDSNARFLLGILMSIYAIFINPIITGLAAAALFPQLRMMREVGSPQALSERTLGLQAVVFMVVAVSWVMRLKVPAENWMGTSLWYNVLSWYQVAGWAPVNSAVFAFVQGVLWWVYWRSGRVEVGEGEGDGDEERRLIE